jgi:hypothetical protein
MNSKTGIKPVLLKRRGGFKISDGETAALKNAVVRFCLKNNQF